ncbi:MAG: hypothetical protein HN704_09200, partial [Bacteroidetes bacterium]|nr:hypothetical protein [Bacteroidota bacterium]
MKFAKLLFSLFVFILIPLISTSQNFSKVDSFRIFLNSECSKNHSIRLWNGEFLIIDNNNGIIFKNENTDTLSVIINYKWYTDSFKQRPAISGVISKNDTIGLINQQANKIAYFTEKGEFIDNVRFKEKFG